MRRDLTSDHAAFLGDPGEAGHDPSKLGLARGVEEEIRPPEGSPWGRGDLAVQRRVRRERPEDPLSLGPLLHRGKVVARVPLRRNRQQLERPRDRVVEGGERLEGRRALDLGHELEVHRRELEAGDEAAIDAEAVVGDARDRCARGRQLVRARTAGTRRAVDLDQPVRQHAPHERTIGVSGWSVKVDCVRLCVRAAVTRLADDLLPKQYPRSYSPRNYASGRRAPVVTPLRAAGPPGDGTHCDARGTPLGPLPRVGWEVKLDSPRPHYIRAK